MSDDGVTKGEHQTVSLAVERINQMLAMLREERTAVARERDMLERVNQSVLAHLELMAEHIRSAERAAAALARMEGNLREGVAEAHRLVDKLPGRRLR